jgi:signal peptidase I
MNRHLRRFLLPRIDRRYLLRVAGVAVAAYVVFAHVAVPARIKGGSMDPTYRNGRVNFCFRLRYLFAAPRRGDLVMVKFLRGKAMYLKRVVAVAGDTIAFRKGVLLINGQEVDEPYVVNPCDWNLHPRKVASGRVYVVGDNRSMPIEDHSFGSANLKRVKGAPLW